MGIGTRLIVLISTVVAIVFAAAAYVSISRAGALAMGDARTIALTTAQLEAAYVNQTVSEAAENASALARVFEAGANAGSVSRDTANAILKRFIERNPGFLAAYVGFEPDAFDGADSRFRGRSGYDDTGRFLPHWSRDHNGSGVEEPLRGYDTLGAGDYYQLPRQRMMTCIIDPRPYQVLGKSVLMTSVVSPILAPGGGFLGIAGVDLDLSVMQSQLRLNRIGDYADAYLQLFSSNRTVVADQDAASLGKPLAQGARDAGYAANVGRSESFTMVRESGGPSGTVMSVGYPFKVADSGQVWMLVVNIPMSTLTAASSQLTLELAGIAAVAVLIVIAVVFLISRSLIRPLSRGVAFAERVAKGDFRQKLAVPRRDEMGRLTSALNGMSVRLSDTVATLQESAQQVAASSERITSGARRLADGAQSQATTLEETSAAVEELTASVGQVAEHAHSQAAAVEQGTASMAEVRRLMQEVSSNLNEIAGLAGKSVEQALQGAQAVSDVVDGINLIASSSGKIGGIIEVIDEIADQTSLLALNASIEAARAGEHGKGFAVVASEVSKLADRSATSTKEIGTLIEESANNVKRGVTTARGSQLAMELIRAASQQEQDTIEKLAALMKQQVAAVEELTKALDGIAEMSQSISAATEEQTANAQQVSRAVENVNEVTQGTASAAEDMAASTEQLSQMAQKLQRMADQFQIRGLRRANDKPERGGKNGKPPAEPRRDPPPRQKPSSKAERPPTVEPSPELEATTLESRPSQEPSGWEES